MELLAHTITLLEHLSQEICTPWDYKQLAQACLSPGDFLIWKTKNYDENDEQRQRNKNAGMPLMEDQLQGVGQYADVQQQMLGMSQYFDQVRLCAKKSLEQLPDSSKEATEGFLNLKQKANEPWDEFLAQVKCAISRKVQHADAQSFLVHQITYVGATKECKQAIRPLKNGNLSNWVYATQDIGTQSYMATTLAATIISSKGATSPT
jgi:hypothetical protein